MLLTVIKIHRIGLVVLPFLLLFGGCIGPRVTANEPAIPVFVDTAAVGTYVHEASGMEFGRQVGRFRRITIRQLNNDAENLKVDYELKPLGFKKAVLTVYVYPAAIEQAANDLQNEYDNMKSYLLDIYPDHNDVAQGDIKIGQPMGPQDGLVLGFSHTAPTLFKNDKTFSGAYLFAHGRWFIKYRLITRYRDKASVERELNSFLHLLQWPEVD